MEMLVITGIKNWRLESILATIDFQTQSNVSFQKDSQTLSFFRQGREAAMISKLAPAITALSMNKNSFETGMITPGSYQPS